MSLLCMDAFSIDAQEEFILTKQDKESIIEHTKKAIAENYFSKDVSSKLADYLSDKTKLAKYDAITDVNEFSRLLTDDLRSVNNDKHFNVSYTIGNRTDRPLSKEASSLYDESQLNNGLQSVSILNGNIGYLNLTSVGQGWSADETLIASAMTLLKNTDALIIDLRKNQGGRESKMLASYLLPEDSILLNTIHWANGTDLKEYTYRKLPAARYSKDVFILTSSKTFSSAEAFTYELQHLKRVTVVGERTGGGANPGRPFNIYTSPAGLSFTVFIPTGQVENPVTKGNWEGIGIKPDVEVSADNALLTAQQEILNRRINKTTDADLKRILNWNKIVLVAENVSFDVPEDDLKKYAGQYGNYEAIVKENKLYMKTTTQAQWTLMTPVNKTSFLNATRTKLYVFSPEKNNVIINYKNGTTEIIEKN